MLPQAVRLIQASMTRSDAAALGGTLSIRRALGFGLLERAFGYGIARLEQALIGCGVLELMGTPA